jgi:RNA polymerase sigma-70 factor (ECF subfamily)
MSDIGPALIEHLPGLRRYAQRLTHDPARADDLIQTCLLKALSKQHLWAEDTNLRAWLFTILHNQFINESRGVIREKNILRTAAITKVTAVPNSDPELSFMVSRVRDAVQSLSNERKEVLLQITVEGLSYGEVASKLHLPVGTVRSRLGRARATLRNETDYPVKAGRQDRHCRRDKVVPAEAQNPASRQQSVLVRAKIASHAPQPRRFG